MNTVNYWLIWQAIGYLEIAELECGHPLGFDLDDEYNAKSAFENYIRPEVDKWVEDRRRQLMLSLVYFQCRKDVLDDRVLANLPDLTMADPKSAPLFFRWLFDSLFPNNDFDSTDITDVVESNEVVDANR